MHIEIMTIDALRKANNLCKDLNLREHVTPFIYQNEQMFELFSFQSCQNNSDIRLTIDYPEDIVFVNKVLKRLRDNKKEENVFNIVQLLRNSDDLMIYNQHIKKDQKIHKAQ